MLREITSDFEILVCFKDSDTDMPKGVMHTHAVGFRYPSPWHVSWSPHEKDIVSLASSLPCLRPPYLAVDPPPRGP